MDDYVEETNNNLIVPTRLIQFGYKPKYPQAVRRSALIAAASDYRGLGYATVLVRLQRVLDRYKKLNKTDAIESKRVQSDRQWFLNFKIQIIDEVNKTNKTNKGKSKAITTSYVTPPDYFPKANESPLFDDNVDLDSINLDDDDDSFSTDIEDIQNSIINSVKSQDDEVNLTSEQPSDDDEIDRQYLFDTLEEEGTENFGTPKPYRNRKPKSRSTPKPRRVRR